MAKKNPFKTPLIVLGLGAIAAAATYWGIKPREESRKSKEDKANLLFPDADRQSILEFRFSNSEGDFHVKREAGASDSWLVSSAKTFEADKSVVDGMLSTIVAAKRESSVPGTELKNFGLEQPKFKLSLTSSQTGDAASQRELWIGDDTPVDYLVYAKWSDLPEVFVTTRSLRFSLDKKLTDLRNKRFFDQKKEALARLDLQIFARAGLAAQNLSFSHDEKTKQWTATAPVSAQLDSMEVEKFLGHFNGARATAFVSEEPKDRPKLGSGQPLAKMTLTPLVSGSTAQVWTLWQKVEGAGKTAKTRLFIARDDQPTTFEITPSFVDNLKVTLFQFREKAITSIDRAKVRFVSISDGNRTVELSSTDGVSWNARHESQGQVLEGKAKDEAVQRLLDATIQLKAEEFLDRRSPAQTGLARPSRAVEIRDHADANSGTTLANLFFGRKLESGRVAVRAENMESAAGVVLDLETTLGLEATTWLDQPPAAEASASTPSAASTATPSGAKGGNRVKLEPSVKSKSEIRKLPSPIVKPRTGYEAVVTLQNGKSFTITFAPDKAPYTVSNFIHLARNGFYDGVGFHRVIRDFVAQGGDPTGVGSGGPGYKFDNEDNDLKHLRGSISMAHAGRNTNGSQFFLVYKPQPHLDGLHTVFGSVTKGMEVVDAIKQGDVMKSVEVFEIAQ